MPLFMGEVDLSKGYRATTRRWFTFYHSVLRSSCTHLIDLGRIKGWAELAATRVLNSGPLDWVLGAPTTRPLLHVKFKLHGSGKIRKNRNQLVMFFDFAPTQILKLKSD